MSGTFAKISGIASYLPENKLTNEMLARDYPSWNVDKIYSKTGIATRSVVSDNECASDLAVAAAEKLIANSGLDRKSIDFVLFCTQSPDYFLPTTACLIQTRLRLSTTCGALDFNLGCSGFVYGLSLAKGLIETGAARKVLLLTAETYTKYIDKEDRSVRTIFGDGAAATLVEAVDASCAPIGPFVFGTDGTGQCELIVPAGGHRKTPVQGAAALHPERLYMNGPEIFNFTLKAVPGAVTTLLDKSQLSLDQVNYFVFHQANKFMLDQIRKKIGIPSDKFCINMESYGNTVSATIPMALELALADRNLVPSVDGSKQVMLVGFGVGYSWAACMVRF